MAGIGDFLGNMSRIDERALGINRRNLSLIYPLNPRKHFKLADDKVLTKEILEKAGVPVAASMGVIERVGDISNSWSALARKSCAIKPAKGRGGGGILVLDYCDGAWFKGSREVSEEEIHRHMANIIFGVYSFGSGDKVLIEEKIVPAEEIKAFYKDGVADLRMIVKQGAMLLGMLRIPTDESGGRANLHQGAIGAGIDIHTGAITQLFDGKSHFTHHPNSGVEVTGKYIPHWGEVVSICHRVFDAFPLEYLGIDIAFDENFGPLVLEINVRPGLEIQNVNLQGLKALLDGK